MPQLKKFGRFDFQRGSSKGQDHRYHWERTTVFTDVVAGTLEVNKGVPPTKRWIRATLAPQSNMLSYSWWPPCGAQLLPVIPSTGAHGQHFLHLANSGRACNPDFAQHDGSYGQYSRCTEFCFKTRSFWMIWTKNPNRSN